ncbi:MAG: molybdopterin-dependent oxidoreductase [Myxococcota bacterium]|jgi:xanthine dehydrogenase large subunit|nr:molybdopterin-dependent oxidoreductase [Myxococcota bacterium]
MRNTDLTLHVQGASQFVDDIPTPAGCLHAALFTSPVARGRLRALHTEAAAAAPGVVAVLTHRDVPGLNQVGHVLPDQPLFAVDEVVYVGQPLALVVADSRPAALQAARLITAEIDPLEAVLDPLEAAARGLIHGQPRTLSCGDPDGAWAQCAHVAEGTIASGPQEHFYFETQRALALPGELGTIKVVASSQSPGTFHRHVAEVLGIPQHCVELEIRRLGGAFGGKESTAVWVVAPALAAFLLKRPVKLVLGRAEDLATTGKRHGYRYRYRIGVDAEGRILVYEATFHQHAGACADISLAVLGRSLLHASGSYRIPNLRVTALSCRTNIPPNNAFRGFGVPQGTFAIEVALTRIAEVMGVPATRLKRLNLLTAGDTLPYGVTLAQPTAIRCWEELDRQVDLDRRHERVAEYNRTHADTKRGLAVVPVCFGISFAQTALNQASALVNIYVDGSVAVSTGAVEMGQGVNTKIALVAARTLGIDPARVRVDTTDTTRVPNASPTSASTGADLNGMATLRACATLVSRLQEFAARHLGRPGVGPGDISIRDGVVHVHGEPTELRWEKLVAAAQWARIDLSSHDFYATPDVYHDQTVERGRPFAYYSYGTSVTEVLLDCVRGTYAVEAVDLVHDAGRPLSETIDRGQIEGGLLQGIGWATLEQLRTGPDGRLRTTVNSYKIPDIKFGPAHVGITLLANSDNPYAVCNSKAIGEPPFIHGIGAYLALLDALRAVRQDRPFPSLPLTPERVLMALHGPAEDESTSQGR